MTVRVNGVLGDAVSPLDRGLHYGDGLFETIACCKGGARFLSLHLERLAEGCRRLRIELPNLPALAAEVRAQAAESDRSIVKILVTRGQTPARGYATGISSVTTHITIRYPWPDEDPRATHDGVRVRTLAMRLGENRELAGLKHCNRLEQIVARSQWPEDAQEGLLYSSSGNLISGTACNVFIVRDGVLLTPRIDLCGVAGVMRRVILREAASAGISGAESELNAADLRSAEEVFISNARIGVMPVRELDSRPLTPGRVTRRLQEILVPLLEQPHER